MECRSAEVGLRQSWWRGGLASRQWPVSWDWTRYWQINWIDELANVPKEKKTKEGYLKDGFVVDASDDEEEEEDSNEEDSDDYEDVTDDKEELDGEIIEDIGSELSEDTYDYSSDEVKK